LGEKNRLDTKYNESMYLVTYGCYELTLKSGSYLDTDHCWQSQVLMNWKTWLCSLFTVVSHVSFQQ